jgi:hypothetical protein
MLSIATLCYHKAGICVNGICSGMVKADQLSLERSSTNFRESAIGLWRRYGGGGWEILDGEGGGRLRLEEYLFREGAVLLMRRWRR